MEGSDLSITERDFVPTARWITDTKKRQLVTRSGLQRLLCCVFCVVSSKAMTAPAIVRWFFETLLQQVHTFKVDVMAVVANGAAYKY